MKWEDPHPSNAAAAERISDTVERAVSGGREKAEGFAYLISQYAIADRLAGIEHALQVLALAAIGRPENGFHLAAQIIAHRLEAEGEDPPEPGGGS